MTEEAKPENPLPPSEDKDIKKAIDNSNDLKKVEKDHKEELNKQKENELKDKRENIINEKREIPNEKKEDEKCIKDIKNINLNRLDYLDSIFKCGINVKYNNNKYYDCIKSGLNITMNLFNVLQVEGEGNCYYKCLSEFLYGKKDYCETLKQAVTSFCQKNIEEINNFKSEIKIKNDVSMSTKDYINQMEKNVNFSNDIDMTISSFLFSINIAIYKYSEDRNNLEYKFSYLYELNNSEHPMMILVVENEHFNIVYPKLVPPEMAANDKSGSKTEGGDKDKENINPYPKYTKDNDENLYLNFFNFLNNGVRNGKRQWPDYIDNIKFKKIRDFKKSDFYRKLGVKKPGTYNKEKEENNGGDTIREKYIIENNRLCVFRFESDNYAQRKLYTIPYAKEVNDLINRCHTENGHKGLQETMDAIENEKYYWVSLQEDVQKFIDNCDVCKSKS